MIRILREVDSDSESGHPPERFLIGELKGESAVVDQDRDERTVVGVPVAPSLPLILQ